MITTETASSNRRHDLDALRAFAMLIGIALHAALSFTEFPWLVQDRSQHPAFGLLFLAVHGFRMPLFFVLSGFFTAMLWRQRGLAHLIKHRARRILLPLVLGCVTIVPVMWMVVTWTGASATSKTGGADKSEKDIWTAAAYGNLKALEGHIAAGADLNREDSIFGQSPLSWATITDQPEAVKLLLVSSADPSDRFRDGSTALHTAAFFGRAKCATLLLDAGADVNARNVHGEAPLNSVEHDRGTTEFIAGLLQIPLDFEAVTAGRKQVAAMLEARGALLPTPTLDRPLARLVEKLVHFPFFHHLWFLWLLCWLVAGFSLVVLLPFSSLPRWTVNSPVCWLWIVPVTMVPQAAMHHGGALPGFGPDTSAGVLPIPHVLLYYTVFFGFGALYYESRDEVGRLGRAWWAHLTLALLLVLPLGFAFSLHENWTSRLLGETLRQGLRVLLEVLYTWLVVFGLMGFFRRTLSGKHPWIRYLSDASYWLYLAHLPLIIAAQALVQNWDLPGLVKFALVLGVVTSLLLVVYRYAIRYTLIGRLLNGPRPRSTNQT